MNCSGIDVATGRFVAMEFDRAITSVSELNDPSSNELLLAPGLIDLQVNGFAGVDFNSPGDPLLAVNAILRTGVTKFLPTLITAPQHSIVSSLKMWLQACQPVTSREARQAFAGFHIEGPNISSEDGPRGAHQAQHVRPPSLDEYREWQEASQGQIKLITLSPHWPESAEYIKAVIREGTAVSIGHTGATAAQIEAAVDAGATLSTHIGNAAHALIRKHPNYIWDQLADDRLSASFIADGIHLGRSFLRTALRARTVAKSVLITDASAPAGAKPGRYHLGEQPVDLTEDGRVVLAGTNKLAGSALTMPKAIEHAISEGGLSLRDALQTATINPARIINLQGRTKGLETGEIADIIAFRMNPTFQLEAVYLEGQKVA